MLWRTPAAKRRPSGFIEPCLPTRVEKPPVGSHWVHEIKHDGYRLIARKDEGIISKHREHPYRSGRSKSWLKIKNPDSPATLRLAEDES